MIVLWEIAAAWLLVVVVLVAGLWVAGRVQCRAGSHSWWWTDGAWRCARCGRPDDRTNREVTR